MRVTRKVGNAFHLSRHSPSNPLEALGGTAKDKPQSLHHVIQFHSVASEHTTAVHAIGQSESGDHYVDKGLVLASHPISSIEESFVRFKRV